ncbi:WD40-repeat-containing domain protein [Cercophora scortea]|uniref:WD40-repeat-containing domain protein n=1 Tax=Cercophora scortea TaxID=314031 RepID=A0AAE0MHV1_9PEZI|nr:WD40-repeat-containing domain protein [Cercophora scortea]
MRFSQTLKSSGHCLPSPDGKHIATLFSSIINVRAVRALEVVHVVTLPPDFTGPVLSLQWSPSSRLLLVAGAKQIRVLSALDHSFHATIKNPVAPGTKPAYVGFGASDTEICVISAFGLKFAVHDLASSKTTEIGSPKSSSVAAASGGFSFRPGTRHLALLTRTAGKDMISIHDFPKRDVLKSWAPDTVDAQGVTWSPDGRWLVVWESAALGHKVIFYTADGHCFKTWLGPAMTPSDSKDYALGAGVKSIQFSADARHLAVGDWSRRICMFNMASATETLRLQHPGSIVPKDTLQVWQEQIGISQTGPPIHTFIRTTQVVSPTPAPRPQDSSDPPTGCVSILFDPSSALLATRFEEFPGTVWIWDAQVAELRAVLLFHGNISNLSWHPSIQETLLIRCEGDQYSGLVFVWDPLSEGPQLVDFTQRLPDKRVAGKWRASWIGVDSSSPPSLFFSDAQSYVLASLSDPNPDSLPWGDREIIEQGDPMIREESPLELVPAPEADLGGLDGEEGDDGSELEDTFLYKQ